MWTSIHLLHNLKKEREKTRDNFVMRNFIICTLEVLLDYEKDLEMGGMCGTQETEREREREREGNAYRNMVGIPDRKELPERSRLVGIYC
jgi:hypothetical protein